MDFKQIQELIRLINRSNIGELMIEEKGFKVIIKQKQENVQHVVAAAPPVMMPPPPPPPVAAAPAPSAPEAPKHEAAEAVTENLITIKSPMIGTFYRRASPDKPLLAEVGDEITPGKVVCIIEAMKLFNEIESEVKGKIVKVLVEDSTPVEYDQPLFLVEP